MKPFTIHFRSMIKLVGGQGVAAKVMGMSRQSVSKYFRGERCLIRNNPSAYLALNDYVADQAVSLTDALRSCHKETAELVQAGLTGKTNGQMQKEGVEAIASAHALIGAKR